MKKLVTQLYITSVERVETAAEAFIEKYILPADVSCLGLAVSGGSDSTALLHLMVPLCKKAHITPVIIHLNHGLRDASDEEAEFVEKLAKSYKISFFGKTLDMINRPKENKSLEMAAREERIRFYMNCMQEYSLDGIATGHHAHDVGETLLLRLARGSGIAGLSGMRPVTTLKPAGENTSDVPVFRPLLNITPDALRGWLELHDAEWRNDLSNLDTKIPRNNVRHTVMPFLRENFKADIDSRLCHSAATLREDEDFLNEIAKKKLAAVKYNQAIFTAPLLQLPLSIQRRVIRLWLFEHDLVTAAGFQTVSDLLARCGESEGRWTVQLNKDILAQFDGELLSIYNPAVSEVLPEYELTPGETILWGDFDIRIENSHGIAAESQGVGVYPASCSLDAIKLRNKTLTVRQRRKGDRIYPTGMKGSKKIKNILIDAKVARHDRDGMPMITCDDEVLWIPGYRISKNYAVESVNAPSVHITVSRTANFKCG
ncbi:MAG: tRNA lysidine(34) synthetase TilS [Kiritimatiellia bacterium]